jgi:glycerol-3-phosphate dehydrogenase
MSFSFKDRPKIIVSLKKDYFDLIVIGGGITGAGIALDAASRGLKVALVDKGDFASGTSSKSTKLIHGGLRYLKQFDFKLVREVGKERATVHKLAPHLVRPEKMLLPLIKDGNYGKIITSVGLMVYDVLADVEVQDQRKMLSKEETLASEPLLKPDHVEGGGLYAEYQVDDARLVIEVIKAAHDFDAKCLNYTQVSDLIYNGGKVCGVKCEEKFTKEAFEIYADHVINASGPWVDEIRKKNKSLNEKRLHLTKGIHIVVDKAKLPIKQSVYFDVSDGRMIFAIPRVKTTYIGTTDTEYSSDKDNIRATKTDVDYLINAVNDMFPYSGISKEDIQSSWAGVRPLIHEEGKSASEISRKDEIFEAENGLISMAGGKLTGYRKMAQKAVYLVAKRIHEKSGKSIKPSRTKRIMLPGNGFKDYKDVIKYKKKFEKKFEQKDQFKISRLIDKYGNQFEDIYKTFKAYESSNDNNIIRAELQFCLNNEMITSLLDFYERRTGRLYFEIDSITSSMEVIADDMGKFLNWTTSEKKEQIQSLKDAIILATTFE